jgi:hypothetical protein
MILGASPGACQPGFGTLNRSQTLVAKPPTASPLFAGFESDAELLLDQLGQPRGRPQFGGESLFQGVVAQPSENDLLLRRRQLAGAARYGTSQQSVRALSSEQGEPTPHRSGRDIEELGDLLGGGSFEVPLDGELAPMFQFLGSAVGSHATDCN